MRVVRWVGRLFGRIAKDDNLDLYALVLAGLVFTSLGAVGIAKVTVLSSVTLALLAFLAFSQIRSRRQIESIAAVASARPADLFLQAFPDDLQEIRSSARKLLYIGVSAARTVQTSRADIARILGSGGTVRVLLLDPTNDALVRAADQHNPVSLNEARLRSRIHQSIDELEFLRKSTGGDLRIRVAPFVPRISVNAIEAASGMSMLVVQHYEHRPTGEPLPIFRLEAKDGFWFQHFSAEAERLWESGLDWPLTVAAQLDRSLSPSFMEAFGPELDASLAGARSLMITGVTRNAFVNHRYSLLERLVKSGCTLRVLLVDPASAAVGQMADRYYADRVAVAVRPRIEQTLRLLHELAGNGDANIEVRVTTHPIGMGIIVVDPDNPDSAARPMFLEYYTFRAPSEPKFVLSPTTDRLWYEHFLREADELWLASKPAPDAAETPTP